MATTGKTKGVEENTKAFADTTVNAGQREGEKNETNPNQTSETSGSGKGWSRSDENADAQETKREATTQQDESAGGTVSRLADRLGVGAEKWSSVQEGAQELIHKAQDAASDYAHRAQDVASDYAHRAQDLGRNAAKKTTSTIKTYPVQSLLIGFGVGCLVGLLVPRK